MYFITVRYSKQDDLHLIFQGLFRDAIKQAEGYSLEEDCLSVIVQDENGNVVWKYVS